MAEAKKLTDLEKKLIVALHDMLHGTRIGPGTPALYPEEQRAQKLIYEYDVGAIESPKKATMEIVYDAYNENATLRIRVLGESGACLLSYDTNNPLEVALSSPDIRTAIRRVIY